MKLFGAVQGSLYVEYYYRAEFIALSLFKQPVQATGFRIISPLNLLEELKNKGVSVSIIEKRVKVRLSESILLNLMAVIDDQMLVEVQRKDGSDLYYLNLIYPVALNADDLPSFKMLGPLILKYEK